MLQQAHRANKDDRLAEDVTVHPPNGESLSKRNEVALIDSTLPSTYAMHNDTYRGTSAPSRHRLARSS